MKRRYILAPEAAFDLVGIWRHINAETNRRFADRVESRHSRLRDKQVKFFPVYSFLIVYRPETKPLQIVAILHGHSDLERLLKNRFFLTGPTV